MMEKDVFPVIGEMTAADVTPVQILDICKKVKARGSNIQAERLRGAISAIYGWGMKEFIVKENPVSQVGKQSATPARRRTPTDAEIKLLWEATAPSKALDLIIRLVIMTGQRRAEVCCVGASEIDLPNRLWTIPGDTLRRGKVTKGRTKNKQPQHVYLSDATVALFDTALRTCRVGEFVFPSKTRISTIDKSHEPTIHPESASRAMARLCKRAGIEDLTLHDFRRGLANWLKENGYSRDVRDLMLNHVDGSVDGKHYSSGAKMEKHCRIAWARWAGHIARVSAAKPVDA